MENREQFEKRIKELEKEVKDLENDLIHDSLTALKTRAFFEEETSVYLEAIASNEKGKRKEWFGFRNLSIAFLDIDHFKKINDTYGHDVGDEVLREVANVLKKEVRSGDTVARWGGEEIVISLLGASEEDAWRKAEELREIVAGIKFQKRPELLVTVSIGVASSENGLAFLDLVKRADTAVYKAKETGRNKVVKYSEL